ncbi:MAG: T9SS type A sorting domain-containing protein [Rudanella sp.]|nr:T9SS type A sorting domain-containing protein [Rudanella sp.]
MERYYPFYANNCGYYRYAVFPNPAQNELNIGFENTNEQKEFPELYELYEESMYGSWKPVRIFSAQNDNAKQELKRKGQITLDVRDLPRGRYVLRILKEKETQKEKTIDEIRVLLN